MKKLLIIVSIAILSLTLGGCNWLDYQVSDLKAALNGRSATIQTYDEDSMPIDRVHGTSIDVRSDGKFNLTNSDGTTAEKSSVVSIVVGKSIMLHVGSSMIVKEDGLVDYFDEFAKTVDINNIDRSHPFIERMKANFANAWSGHKKVILIRSQTGKPLATFAGESVSYFATDIDKSTAFWIDGKFLLVYRCDYTVYDTALLQ